MAEPNYAGNIIVNLADLPEFLRKPILQKRLTEFFSMSQEDRKEIINNALQAGPTIRFDKFSTLFKTWLEVLCNFSEEQRTIMFAMYLTEILNNPQKIILFNLDGIFEIYLSLTREQKNILSDTVRKIINSFDSNYKRRLFLIIPERIKKEIGI
jgi:phosphopantetheine adenylyltransferase